MRSLFALTLLALSFLAGESCAQDVIPRAIYNPDTGDVYFDNLDPIFDADRGRLRFLSTVDTIQEQDILEGRAGKLDIPARSRTTPTIVSQRSATWQLEGPFGGPIVQPVYAGSIVEPGTDITNLVIQSFWLNKEPLGEVVLIPEPSALGLSLVSTMTFMAFRVRHPKHAS